MAASVGAFLEERALTLAVSESSCGGLLSTSLVAVPGASAYYVGCVAGPVERSITVDTGDINREGTSYRYSPIAALDLLEQCTSETSQTPSEP